MIVAAGLAFLLPRAKQFATSNKTPAIATVADTTI
jgi:hypothetical protein